MKYSLHVLSLDKKLSLIYASCFIFVHVYCIELSIHYHIIIPHLIRKYTI